MFEDTGSTWEIRKLRANKELNEAVRISSQRPIAEKRRQVGKGGDLRT